jgi:hypothetical protein
MGIDMILPHNRKDKSGYYISLWQMLRHQFVVSIRTVGKSVESGELLSNLGSAQKRAFTSCGKGLLLAFVAYMIGMKTEPSGSANVSVFGHVLTLPMIFVNFFISFCYFQVLQSGINGLIVGEFARTASIARHSQKGSMASRISYDIDGSWSMLITPFYGFLNSGRLHLTFSAIAAVCIFLPFVLVLGTLGADVIYMSSVEILNTGVLSVSGIISISTILLVLFSTLLAASLFYPFYFKKNSDFVRWNFLYPLLYRGVGVSSSVERWLDRANENSK